MLGDQPKTSVIEVLLLHSRADRALRSLLAGQFDKHNITMMEWLLLGVLAGGSRDGLSISTVAAKLDVALPQVTALMARLQKKKLIRLRTQKHDRRSRHAMLTARGEDVLGRVEEAAAEIMQRWPAGISLEQISAYVEITRAMARQRRRELSLT